VGVTKGISKTKEDNIYLRIIFHTATNSAPIPNAYSWYMYDYKREQFTAM
jgi:hypothetical protein